MLSDFELYSRWVPLRLWHVKNKVGRYITVIAPNLPLLATYSMFRHENTKGGEVQEMTRKETICRQITFP